MNLDYKRLEILTRFIIFLPLVVALIFIFKIDKNNVSLSQNNTIPVEESQTVRKTNTKSRSIDLVGPYSCSYNEENTSVQVSVQNKNILVDYQDGETLNHIIVTKDCGYMWNEGEKTGQKMCNIAPYLSMIETMSSFNMLNFDSMLSMVHTVDPSIDVSREVSDNIMQTCLEGEIDEDVFSVPENIVFTEIQSLTPTENSSFLP